jgi:iron complex outermembrane recepter protein
LGVREARFSAVFGGARGIPGMQNGSSGWGHSAAELEDPRMTNRFDSHRWTLLGGAAAFALALGSATPAFAQDTADEEQPTADASPTGTATDDEDADIVVTGFRAALENAVQEKKGRDQVVESISAEDIGKLPDASIAESIARLPGLTSQRVSGRSNSISIRGFSPDFSTTLLNGREQTSTGDNRAVEYDQYPSEIVNQVLIYKTPMARIVGQGLSGTVDLRTIRPLEFGRRVWSFGARGAYADLGKLNVDSHDKGYRVGATYIDQYANDTIGLAVSASYTDEPYQIQEFNSWGYPTDPGAAIIGGSKSYITSTQLKRLGLQGTLEFRPVHNFTSTFDVFYSDFKDDQIKRGIELPLWWGGAPLSPGFTVTDGLVSAGTFNNVEGVVRNDSFQRHAKLTSLGWNGKYEGEDGWNVMGDISFSKTDRNELVLETYAGTGRGQGNGATDTIGFMSGTKGTTFTHVLNYGDFNLIKLTSPLGWGGNQTDVNGNRIIGGQDGYYNNRIIEDELWQLRGEIEREFDGSLLSSVVAGVNYTNRTKSLTPDEAFLGLVANTDGLTDVPVPVEFRLGTSDQDFLGLGPVISYDPVALLNAGIYQRVRNPFGDVVVKAYNVEETQKIAYLQANLRTELGLGELTGNIGVQAIHTDQRSEGASAILLGFNPNGSPNIGGIARDEGASYWDILPSLNLALRLSSDFVIRFAAAREIIRPRLDDMRASLSYGTSIRITPGTPPTAFAFVGGSSGNPQLRPWRANALDLTFEKYFGTKGYLAAQFFWKDLRSYIFNQTINFDYSAFPFPDQGFFDPDGAAGPLPPQHIDVRPIGDLTVPINGKGGKLYGVEVAGTLPFGEFIDALDGFGVTGGASWSKSKIRPSPNEPPSAIPGYSEWVVNGTAFFEKYGFSARGSIRYRSTFIGELSGFGASRVRRRAAPEMIVDAQVGYDFQPGSALEGLSVFVSGQNLTNEPFVTHNPGQPDEVIDYQTYGRRYMAGFNFKF